MQGLVHCTLANGGVGVVACNWLAPDAGEPFQELTVIGTEGTAWVSGGKLHALGCNDQIVSAERFTKQWILGDPR